MNRKLALIIGNSKYEDTNLASLVTPGADVNALAEVLRDPEIGGFDEVVALVNQPVATIRRAIASFFVDRGREDLLLLYFSGHGMRDDRGQLYLAAKDTEHNLLRGTAIPSAFITEEMDNSRSRRQVLILDCCHSGAFSRGMKGATGVSVGTAAAFEGTGSGRIVLTATDSTQYAWEGDRVIGQAENSVFTQYLIQGLRTGAADSDADGRITLDELYDYVYELVVNETPKQTPSKWSYGQQGEIVIARNPHPVVKPVELPPEVQQTIDDPRPWVREGAVRELDRLMRGSSPGLALAAREALKRLADDDSRRVAAAAAESLAAFAETQHPTGGTEAVQEVPARQIEREEKARPMAERTETEPGAHRQPAVATRRKAMAAMTGGSIWMPILMVAAGWAIGGLIGGYISWISGGWILSVILIGAIGGLATGLVLRRIELSIRWKQILMIAAGWAIGWLVGGAIGNAISPVIGKAVANAYYAAISWDLAFLLGSILGGAIAGAIGGAIGGLSIGLVLWQKELSTHWKQIRWVAIGWAIGMAISVGIVWAISIAANGVTDWPNFIRLALSISISGAIGSVFMFSQLGQARDFGAIG